MHVLYVCTDARTAQEYCRHESVAVGVFDQISLSIYSLTQPQTFDDHMLSQTEQTTPGTGALPTSPSSNLHSRG